MSIIPADRFRVLLQRNIGKVDGLTYDDLAKALPVARKTLQNEKSEGRLKSFGKIGRNPVFAFDDIYAWYVNDTGA